ncbi:MAG TPA: head GIN domain-containing protein [Chryseosolibacter sp.]
MKKSFLVALSLLVTAGAFAQQEIQKELKSFSHIIASPRVNLILKKGDKESIRLVYNDVSKSKINIEVSNHTLHIYLDNARKVEKMDPYEPSYGSRRNMYDGVSITAYVTYRSLEGLEIRGNQELTCYDPIESSEFRLRAYGENDITLASLKTDFFKATLYGTNKLKISKGKVVEQKYKLYGENKIDTRDLKSAYASTSIFGEGQLRITSTEEVRVDAFGEPDIYVNGGAHVNRRLVFGRTHIQHD